MNLPSLNNYKDKFIKAGIPFPVRRIPYCKAGLLSDLPTPPANKTGWPWTEQTDPQIYNERAIWPKLTIVSPSYNQANFLEETIRSILLQNYPNLEYIIMDGGSTDNTQKILEQYSPWISYWQSEKDGGQGQAINLGFSLASGDYRAWINSDDYYLKNVFSIVINKFLKTKTDFIYGYGFSYHVKKHEFEALKVLPFLDFFIKIPGIIQPSTFWSSEIHKPIWEELHCSLDFELWLRLVKGNKRYCIKKPLSVANVHDEAKTYDPVMKGKWYEDHLKIWSAEAHGPVPEWKRIVFLNRIRMRLYKILNLI